MLININKEIVDKKLKRLLKQILRYLLPKKEDRKFKELLNNAINNFFEDLRLLSRHKALITSSFSS
jgi:hypothetical protein